MKQALLKLLQEAKTTGRDTDDVAEDILALTIRYALPTPTMAAPANAATAEEIEHAVDDVYVDSFGAQLHNLYTTQDFPGKRKLYHSARCKVVKAMLRAMLIEGEEHFDRTALHSGDRIATESAAIQ